MNISTPPPLAGAATTAPGSDAELIGHALQGDQAAFEAIMRRHNRLLFRAARGVVADDAEAQDVVQETYLRAFTQLQDFQGGASLGTWLARIAINLALDVLRKRGRSVPMDGTQDLDHEPSTEHMMSFSAPPGASPEAALERGELRQLLQSAVEGLPPIYRSVFILRAVQEMSVEETAFCLQVSDAVVKTRYLRARALLRDALGARIEAHAESAFPFAGERCEQVVRYVVAELQQRQRIARR
ncbi:RNA polymerase subunit sigma-24 [Acidovorax carolinensis]|uniref:RNA polymerase sigma factor n=1 Tax=Acidovorax carolinensis TaxID=553814 RepID=A0A240U0L1_9BURK|nr:RNA polymerase sigma factor [Acidovorax carolinensis]ART50900.1 RNA polymerase subunit sigma-24 [Acidovorax carolinensis]